MSSGAIRASVDRMSEESGRRGPVECTTAAQLVGGSATVPVLVTNLSLDGLCLRGRDLPEVGTTVALSLLVPSGWLPVSGHIRWVDREQQEAGVALARTSPQVRRDLAVAMLAFAFEFESSGPTALLLVDDSHLAADLCEPLRAAGYVPQAFRTPLDAILRIERDRSAASVAIVTARALSHDASEWLQLLADRRPLVKRLLIADLDHGVPVTAGEALPFETLLSHSGPRLALESVLAAQHTATTGSLPVGRSHRRRRGSLAARARG